MPKGIICINSDSCEVHLRSACAVRPLTGWVYAVMGEESGRWKVGWARDPERRFRELQTGCPEDLHPWGVIPAAEPIALESYLHRRFAKHRLRGEWFAPNDGIEWFFERWGYEYGGRVRLWTALNPPSEGPPPRPHPAFRHLLAPAAVE